MPDLFPVGGVVEIRAVGLVVALPALGLADRGEGFPLFRVVLAGSMAGFALYVVQPYSPLSRRAKTGRVAGETAGVRGFFLPLQGLKGPRVGGL